MTAPPTLEEMLVAGTPANAMLSSMLTAQQQPHVVYPLAIEPVSGTSEGTAGQGHRLRQLQGAEPEPEPEDEAIAVRASLKIKAPTGQHAAQLASHLVSLYPDCVPGATTSNGRFDYTQCANHAFAQCHLEACAGRNPLPPPPPPLPSLVEPPAPTTTGGKGRRLHEVGSNASQEEGRRLPKVDHRNDEEQPLASSSATQREHDLEARLTVALARIAELESELRYITKPR